MDKHKNKVLEMSIARTMGNLRKNRIDVDFLPSKSDVVPMIRSIIDEGSTIALGGSSSLSECNVIQFVRSGPYNLIDRYEQDLTEEAKHQRFIEAFTSDVFITGVNAITEHGELYCIDGTSNRISAMLFGPKKVIIVAGYQKIVPTLRDAVHRVKHIAAPANAIRLGIDAPCVTNGYCVDQFFDEEHLMSITPGACDYGICSNMVVFGRQPVKGRVSLLLVGEEIGY